MLKCVRSAKVWKLVKMTNCSAKKRVGSKLSQPNAFVRKPKPTNGFAKANRCSQPMFHSDHRQAHRSFENLILQAHSLSTKTYEKPEYSPHVLLLSRNLDFSHTLHLLFLLIGFLNLCELMTERKQGGAACTWTAGLKDGPLWQD